MGKGDPLDLNNCGPSSIQCFDGEDHQHDGRKKSQQMQLRDWCSKGIKEASDKIKKKNQDMNEYSQHVIEEDKMRCDMAKEKELHRRHMAVSVMMENKQLAEEMKKRRSDFEREEKQMNEEETKGIMTSPFYCEDTDYAKSVVSDHRFRPDHFKGFEKDTLKSIIHGNETVVAEKILLQEEEQKREQLWADEQREMIMQMELLESERMKLKEEENKLQAETLLKQREELKQKQLQMKRESFGSIGEGNFFQKFGTSCR